MTELRDLLQRAAPPAPAFDDHAFVVNVDRRARRRRVSWFASGAIVAVVVAGAVVAVAHHGSGRPAVSVSPSTVAETTTTFTLPRSGYQSLTDVPELPASAVHTVSLPDGIDGNNSALDGTALWVAGCGGDAFRCRGVARLDLATGEVHDLPGLAQPSNISITQIAYGNGGVFILTNGYVGAPYEISRLDPVTGNAQWTVSVPGTSVQGDPKARLAFGAGRLWFSDGTLPVRVFSPADGSVRATIPIDGYVENNGQVGFAFDGNDAYVVGTDDGTTVLRIDPTTKTAAVAHDFSPGFSQSLAGDGSYVWTTHFTQRGRLELVRIDTADADRAVAVGVPTYEVAAGDGDAWFLGWNPVSKTNSSANDYGAVGRIDPQTGRIIAQAHVDVDALDTTWLIVQAGKAYVIDDTKHTLTTVTP